MKKAVFDFANYRTYLQDALPVSGPGRGARARLAELLGCQSGFVSLVLGGSAHFSLEHAATISRFLGHDSEERDFFLLLVHLGRAGSKELEAYYKERIDEIRRRRREIKARIQEKTSLSDSDQVVYYSSWHYVAVHVCLLVPRLRTRDEIAHYLGLPRRMVVEALGFLVRVGLAQMLGDHYVTGPTRMHLPATSPLVGRHHANWRMRAIESLDRTEDRDLHYSSIMSISRSAAERIRAILLDSIQHCEPVIRDAKDEALYVLAIDLFSVSATADDLEYSGR